MSITAMRRASVVLLVAALCVAAGYAALSAVAGSPATAPQGGEVSTPRAEQDEPEIGTAILMVRNADGSVTTTER